MKSIPALDGLRGLAVLLVVFRHAAYLGGHANELPAWLKVSMLNGWVGVDLFFVLSGYLIARPFFSGRVFLWRIYLVRRALRIFPAYIFVIAIVGCIPFYRVSPEAWGWRVFYHLLFLQDYLPSDIVITLWSLGVEEKFYLLAPLFLPWVLSLGSLRRQLLALGAIVLIGPLTRLLTIYFLGPAENYPQFFNLYRSPFHTCIDGLFAGVTLACLQCSKQVHLSRAVARTMFCLGLFGLAVVVLVSEILVDIGVGATIWRPLCLGVLMSLLVGGAVFGGAFSVFEVPIVRWFGRISYSLYLIHVPLIYPALEIAKFLGGGAWGFLAVHLTLSLGSAQLMYLGVERPFLHLKTRLAPSGQPCD